MLKAEDLLELYIILPAAVISVLASVFGYLVYSGLFTNIQIGTQEPVYGDLTVCYKTGRGPYKNTGELFQECKRLLPNKLSIGIYYDDPESVSEELLRFAVGVVVAKDEEIPAADDVRTLISNGYKIAHFPKPNYCVMVSFPFRTMLSIYIAIFRIYPKLKDYIFSRGLCAYPAIEIYSKQHIQFMMPLSRQEEFFVPEFSDELVSNATTELSSHPDLGGAEPDEREVSVRNNVLYQEEELTSQEMLRQNLGANTDDEEGQVESDPSCSQDKEETETVRRTRGASKQIKKESENAEEGEISSSSSFEDLASEIVQED